MESTGNSTVIRDLQTLVPPTSTSPRLWTRFRRRLRTWRAGAGLLAACNGLYSGRDPHTAAGIRPYTPTSSLPAAWAQIHLHALRLGSCAEKGRRGSAPTGVHALAALFKLSSHGYSVVPGAPRQVPLCASSIDEPPAGVDVPMLEALPPEEAAFYEKEIQVLDMMGKSHAVAADLEDQYVFLGGSRYEWLQYHHRADLAPGMWSFLEEHEVKAVAGVSSVPKKDPRRQRKLIMCCSTNYWWSDIRRRSSRPMATGRSWCMRTMRTTSGWRLASSTR